MRPCIEFEYPEFSGAYALVKDGRVVYVGQSINVLMRLTNHRDALRRHGKGKESSGWQRRVIEFDRVRLYPCPKEEMDSLERELIMLFDPECNVRKPKVRRVDIEALAARAGVDYEQWKRDYAKYPQPTSSGYRRA